jgi:hypothetical protein
MRCKILGTKGTWREIANSANTTIGRETGEKEPSSNWKRRILLSEHSPIRQLSIKWKWYDLMYWVSVHLVRHKIGIEHWVRSQRSDRTVVPTNRNETPQSANIEHECEANAQALINISRKRLCSNASLETRQAWQTFLETIKENEPELDSVCVPDCIYRGWCYEFKSCNFHKTPQFLTKLNDYRNNVNV